MSTQVTITQQEQVIAKIERNIALQQIKQRRADTRHKIELGGLVIKAGLDEYSKAVILGALIDAVQHLQHDQTIHKLFKTKGEAAFLGYEDKPSTKDVQHDTREIR